MARTTPTAVIAILLDNYDGSSSLTPFINTAYRMVNRVVTCATSRGVSISADELVDIESYLAAGFYFGKSGQQLVVEERTEKAQVKFRENVSEGYIETAKMIDPSGCLAGMLSGNNPQFEWLGKPPSEQTAYTDRD